MQKLPPVWWTGGLWKGLSSLTYFTSTATNAMLCMPLGSSLDCSSSSLELYLLVQADFLLSLTETSKVTLGYPHQGNQFVRIWAREPHASHRENLENTNPTVQMYQKKGALIRKAGPKFTEVPLAMDLDTHSEALIFNSSFCYQMCHVLVK